MADSVRMRMKNWSWTKILLLFIIPLVLYISLLPVMALVEPEEARYSDIPSLMNRTGDYVTPHLNHVIYLEKPPLCYWVTAFFFKIFGENEFSSRLFAALCAWGCILLVYRMGKFFHDEKTGLYSAGVFSTFLYSSILGKVNVPDMPLTFFVSLATWAGYRYFAGNRERKGWIYLLYIGSALGFLTKGLIGIVFPFAIMILWLLISERWHDLLGLVSPVGVILFLLISSPWVILVQRANHDFLWFFFIQEHFLRYTTKLHKRSKMILFYVPVLLIGTLPWSAFFLKAFKGIGRREVPFFKTTEKRFLLIWIFFIFVFFSVSSSKLVFYIAPIFLPIAVVLGHLFRLYEDRPVSLAEGKTGRVFYDLPVIVQSLLFIAILLMPWVVKALNLGVEFRIDWSSIQFGYGWQLIALPILIQVTILFLPALVQRRWGKGWFLTVCILSAMFFVAIHFPVAKTLTYNKSAYPVSKAIDAWLPPGQELFQFRTALYGIDFYNKARTPLVDACGELDFGYIQLSPAERARYFYLSPETFYQRCNQDGDIYCVTRYKKNVEVLKKRVSNLEVLWENGQFYLLRLRR